MLTTHTTHHRHIGVAACAAVSLITLLASVAAAGSHEGSEPSPRPLAAASAPTTPKSASCSGLKNYEIVRASASEARCSPGNVVTGGACRGTAGGGPLGDGDGWGCDAGGFATAICVSLCSRASEPQGACCSGSACSETTATQCAAGSGVYEGDGTRCGATSCLPLGACCFSSAGKDTCSDHLLKADCKSRGGVYLGDLVHCDFDVACKNCPNRPECAP